MLASASHLKLADGINFPVCGIQEKCEKFAAYDATLDKLKPAAKNGKTRGGNGRRKRLLWHMLRGRPPTFNSRQSLNDQRNARFPGNFA
jgi:hypothetical protein